MQINLFAFVIFYKLLDLTVAQLVENCGRVNETLLYNDTLIAADTEFPWAALIGFRGIGAPEKSVDYNCQGILVSKRIVVTVNHCVQYLTEYVGEVLLGHWTNEEPDSTQIYKVDEIILNDNYNPRKFTIDLALMHLDRDVEFNDYIQPICLPPADFEHSDIVTKHLYLAGRNQFESKSKEADLIKRKTVVHIISPQYCKEEYFPPFNREQHICGYKSNSTKEFLSGAGIVDIKIENSQPKYYFLVGLDSFKLKNKPIDFIGIAGIKPNTGWIKRHIRLSE